MDIQISNNFLIVAREENITRAAELLHLAQSTLSRQMINLEKELGVKLLERQKYKVSLTEEGMLFRRRAQEIITISEMAKEELQQIESELTGEISIGCNESRSMEELAKIIREFRKKFPMVTFDIRSGNNTDIKEWLDNGIVDIGLLGEPVEVEKYAHLKMRQKDEWGILLSKKHPLSKRKSVNAKVLAGIPLLTIRDDVIHSELTSWSGKYADRMVPIMHYNLLSNAASLITDTESVAVCAKPFCYYTDLEFIPFEPKLYLGSLLAWKDHQSFSRATQSFLSFLKQNISCT